MSKCDNYRADWRFYLCCSAALMCMGVGRGAHAADLTILKPGANKKIGIYVSAEGSSTKSAALRAVLLEDLKRSGWFESVPVQRASYTVSMDVTGNGSRHSADVALTRDSGQQSVFRRTFRGAEPDLNRVAHEICDAIVLAVKNRPGIATSRILMVGRRNGQKDLYICDYDGEDLQQVTRDGVPCHSPSWGETPNIVYYTSAHAGFPDIYQIELNSRKRTRVSKYPGLNAGAAVSPDGRSMALILSKDGNPELYVKDMSSGHLQRMTKTPHASEASPAWSPDGLTIAFVSDSTGSPQVYMVSRRGGKPKRLTLRGTENVSPDWGSSGSIVVSSRRDRRYQLVLVDPTNGQETQLTRDATDHEEPSWAPDGRHIVYTRSAGFKDTLYILDTLGDPEVALTRFPGDWYSPAWSRFP